MAAPGSWRRLSSFCLLHAECGVEAEGDGGFGGDDDVAVAGVGGCRGASAAAGQAADEGSFATTGDAANDGSEAGASTDEAGGTLPASFAFLLIFARGDSLARDGCEFDTESSGTLEASLAFRGYNGSTNFCATGKDGLCHPWR